MLNKRTNILFDQNIFDCLAGLADKENTSLGDLVRKAVIKVYFPTANNKRQKAIDKTIKLRKKIKNISLSEIKELINYGRKY